MSLKKMERAVAARGNQMDKIRVLILEDSPADSELVEKELKRSGFRAESLRVKSRSAFVDALKNFKPELILADYALPKFDAPSALKLVREKHPWIPFIIVTGSVSEEVAVTCMKQGADDYLLKDRLTRLGEAVRQALDKSRLRREKGEVDAALQASELRYRTFIDTSTDMTFLKDEQFRHVMANPVLCRFFGRNEAEVLGKTDFELMEKGSAEACRRTDLQSLQEDSIVIHIESVGDRFFETRKFPVRMGDGTIGVGGYIRDITESQRAEAALRESEEKYRVLVENANDIIYSLTLDGVFSYVSPTWTRILGHDISEVVGHPFQPFVHLQDFPACLEFFEKTIMKGEKRAGVEYRVLHKDGTWRWHTTNASPIHDGNGKIVAAMGIARDITERKRMEERLAESELKYRELVEHANSIILRWTYDGRITFLNEFGQRFFGYSAEEIVGRNLNETIVPATDHSGRDLRRLMDQIRAAPGDFEHNVNENIRRDGKRVWIEWTNRVVQDAQGKVVEILSVGTDVTERKRAEEQVRASLQEKEVLLKEIHHRVKNNLQVISGLLTLQMEQVNDERLQRVIRESQSRIWTMALIHQTLYQSGNLADIDMADYIRTLAGNLLCSHAQGMPPTVSFDLIPVRLVIDKAIPLALIINELVTNAMKHAFPDGHPGEIRIALRGCRDRSRPVPTGDMDAKSYMDKSRLIPTKNRDTSPPAYELTVADNGSGLPTGFDPENQKSLGLQLVTMLAKQLGGVLVIERDGGAVFRVTFPNDEKTESKT